MLDLEIAKKARELQEKYEALSKDWEKQATAAKTDSDYQDTRKVFDKSLEAHKEWQEYLFNNGRALFLHRE